MSPFLFFIDYYFTVLYYKVRIDIKEFTLQNKYLKTALACVSNTGDSEVSM